MFRIKGRVEQTGTKSRRPRESFELNTVARGGGREGREEVTKRHKRENLLQQTGSIMLCSVYIVYNVYIEKNHTCVIHGVIVTGVSGTEKTA